jgi:hypothetical protein
MTFLFLILFSNRINLGAIPEVSSKVFDKMLSQAIGQSYVFVLSYTRSAVYILSMHKGAGLWQCSVVVELSLCFA